MKSLGGRFKFDQWKSGIKPPLLILISGVPLTGKSTLGQFLKLYMTCKGNAFNEQLTDLILEKLEIKLQLVSTNSVKEVRHKYLFQEKDPINDILKYEFGTIKNELDIV